VERLRPDVLEAIREHVSYGEIPPAPPTYAERLELEHARPSAEAAEAAERHLAELEDDELRAGERAGSIPPTSS
jgi:hypothetical protein